jgi:small nuclear ribonucleoprotein (snRNP)-like protein
MEAEPLVIVLVDDKEKHLEVISRLLEETKEFRTIQIEYTENMQIDGNLLSFEDYNYYLLDLILVDTREEEEKDIKEKLSVILATTILAKNPKAKIGFYTTGRNQFEQDRLQEEIPGSEVMLFRMRMITARNGENPEQDEAKRRVAISREEHRDMVRNFINNGVL